MKSIIPIPNVAGNQFIRSMAHQILLDAAPSVAPVQKNWYLEDIVHDTQKSFHWLFVAAFGAEEA